MHDDDTPPPAVLPYRRAAGAGDRPDECYRCGYPLLGIDDEQACPECGLLARRSRRESDALHNTQPRWLRRISCGVNLILIAMLLSLLWPFPRVTVERLIFESIAPRVASRLPWGLIVNLGHVVAALVAFAGIWLLASPEGYPPADRADRRLRGMLRLAGVAPIAVVVLYAVGIRTIRSVLDSLWRVYAAASTAPVAMSVVSALLCTALPLLVFMRLRGLAKRARSAHLAEHCLIVGVGATGALLYVAALIVLGANAERLGLGQDWFNRSNVALSLLTIMSTAALLFTMWSIYLLVRFAIAFRRAARQLRGQWQHDDRAASPVAGPVTR
ncbi:MAG: hypothetical protein WBD40_11165 [Tepidisphaeraceae bacterium]